MMAIGFREGLGRRRLLYLCVNSTLLVLRFLVKMARKKTVQYCMVRVIVLTATLVVVYFFRILTLEPTWSGSELHASDGGFPNNNTRNGKKSLFTSNAYLRRLENRRKHISSVMSRFISSIETSGSMYLGQGESESDNWAFPTDPETFLYAHQWDYFARVRNATHVSTVYIEVEMEELNHFLAQEYYTYSSNDCELVQSTAIKGDSDTNDDSHPVCRYDVIGAARENLAARRSMLKRGLPPLVTQQFQERRSQPAGTGGKQTFTNPSDDKAIPSTKQYGNKDGKVDGQKKRRPALGTSRAERDAGDNTNPHYRTRRNHEVRESVLLTYIHVIQNGVVLKEGNVMSRELQIVPLHCFATAPRWLSQHEASGLRVEDEIFTIVQEWGVNYFHSTIENLPRLSLYLDFLQKNPNIKIHVAYIHPFLTELLGVSDDRFVTGDVRARVIYVPAGNPCGQSLLVNVQALSIELRESAVRTWSSSGDQHDLSRRDTILLIRRSSKRYFKHHDAILSMLQRHADPRGLTVRVFGDWPVPSVRETASLFSKALIVVAPHGAGESNILFSQPGTVLIEGLCFIGGRTNMCFRDLTLALGLRYYGIVTNRDCLEIIDSDIELPYVGYLDLLAEEKQRT